MRPSQRHLSDRLVAGWSVFAGEAAVVFAVGLIAVAISAIVLALI